MRENIPIYGIAETQWKENGHFNIADYTIYIVEATGTAWDGATVLV